MKWLMKKDVVKRLMAHPAFVEMHPNIKASDVEVVFDTPGESLLYLGEYDSAWLWRKTEGWTPVYLEMDNLPDEGDGGSFFEENLDKYEKMFGFLSDETAFSVYRDKAAVLAA